MDITLENEYLKIAVKSKGAELFSVRGKNTQLEYIWSGDPAVWGKTSPILFPIVGTLRNNTYLYHDKTYKLSRHGFARDSEFEIGEHNEQYSVFLLKDTAASFENYPFTFELFIKYALDKNLLKVTYEVKNTGITGMYFSIGGHPAFKIPVMTDTSYEDYFLEFNALETAGRWPINNDGLVEREPLPFFDNSARVDLSHKLFEKDALVFKDLNSDKVALKTATHDHGIEFNFAGFPFLGLWAAKGGNFVCIEPWCGIADSVDHNHKLICKEGMQKLSPGSTWSRQWTVRFY
ncbi:MAG: aldose 1-epimerase family protein [Ginsengibacter sp.]